MAAVTAGAVTPVGAPFNTTPAASGTFIPTLWSSKLNAKFYAASVFGEIANTDWEGELKSMGDKIIINNMPDIIVSNYTIGANLSYQVPTPSVIELAIDRAKSFAFQVHDVLAYQAQPDLMNSFSNDASMAMKVAVDSTVWYGSFSGSDAANKGAAAGAKSGSFNMGTDTSPVVLTAANVLATLTAMSGVLDEQFVPETDRWLVIDSATRQVLMNSNLAQAQFMGDSTSMVRNGKIGIIDRFTVYVSNNLPRASAGTATPWLSGDGSESTITSTSNLKRRVLVAGHKSAISFAAQMNKVEDIPNPNDFGRYVRALQIFGFKVVKPQSLVTAVVA
jgi:hypothetical protein